MISVIVPVFNMQEYLPDCLESVINQTELPDELIIVDDGSTDNSLEIARKYEGEIVRKGMTMKVKVIAQTNKGLASARNAGIMNVSGDRWPLFLDADDMLMEDCVRRVIDTYWKERADIIAPSFKTFGTSNENIILMNNPKLEDFRAGNRIAYCCAIRKRLLLEVGGYSPKMTWGYEDLALTCLLLSRGAKIVTIPEPLWLYRTKAESMWTKAKEHHQELLDIINKDVPQAQLNF